MSELPTRFESSLAELEAIVTSMESGQLSLEDSLAAYQRGAELLQSCQQFLDNAKQHVDILENGVLKPFLQPGLTDAE